MPWYAWYSSEQERLYGYAHYLNRRGEVCDVTEISQDPDHVHAYGDSIKLGRVTHFIGVQRRNHTKRRGREPDKMTSVHLNYERSGVGQPSLILN